MHIVRRARRGTQARCMGAGPESKSGAKAHWGIQGVSRTGIDRSGSSTECSVRRCKGTLLTTAFEETPYGSGGIGMRCKTGGSTGCNAAPVSEAANLVYGRFLTSTCRCLGRGLSTTDRHHNSR